jgi:hypothetical protein
MRVFCIMALITLLDSTPITTAGTSAAVSVSGYRQLTIQALCSPQTSTFHFYFEFSIDGTNWFALPSTSGTQLQITCNTTTPYATVGNVVDTGGSPIGEQIKMGWTSPSSGTYTISAVISAV